MSEEVQQELEKCLVLLGDESKTVQNRDETFLLSSEQIQNYLTGYFEHIYSVHHQRHP